MEVVELEGESLSRGFVGVGWTRESVWRVMEQVFMWDPFRLSRNDSIHKMMVKVESHVPLYGNDTSPSSRLQHNQDFS